MNDSFCDGLWQLSDNFIDEEEEEEYFQVDSEDAPVQIIMETKEAESYDVAMGSLGEWIHEFISCVLPGSWKTLTV